MCSRLKAPSSTSSRGKRSWRCRPTDRNWRFSRLQNPIATAQAGSGFVAMADLETRPLQGTDGATSVFWSPDGRSLAFFADGKLKRFDLPAGPALTVCDVSEVQGAMEPGALKVSFSWDTPHGRTISAVPATGGAAPREILTANRSTGRRSRALAVVPPRRQTFSVHSTARRWRGRAADRSARRRQMQSGVATRLMRVSSNAQWVDPDIVVFAREGVLMAQRVDLKASRARR